MENKDKTIIKVVTYKDSGKYYSDLIEEVTPEHSKLAGFQFAEFFIKNNPQVWKYSPVTSGFGSNEFYHTIDVIYPENVNKFCTLLLKPFNQRK